MPNLRTAEAIHIDFIRRLRRSMGLGACLEPFGYFHIEKDIISHG
jgi:hypothetical protein